MLLLELLWMDHHLPQFRLWNTLVLRWLVEWVVILRAVLNVMTGNFAALANVASWDTIWSECAIEAISTSLMTTSVATSAATVFL